MGRFLNPDNTAFQSALNSEIYIDKTEFTIYNNKKEELEKQTQTLMRQLGFQKISKGV